MVDVSVKGLKEFAGWLETINPELHKAFTQELAVVAKVVADDAKSRLPRRTGRAARTIRAGATNEGPYVAGGSPSVPYYGWLDFGSRIPRTGRPISVGPWARSGTGPRGGRALFPAIEDNQKAIVEGGEAAMKKALAAALAGMTGAL